MTDAAPTPPTTSLAVKLPARSMGLKLLLVCGLALLMAIPALFIFKILYDRTHTAEQVVQEIGGLIGGPQTFLGPVLSVPYTVVTPAATAGQPATVSSGAYIVYPEVGRVTADVKTSVRKRGLFKATVWNADLDFAFETTIIHWRGPAPFFFAPLPPAEAERVPEPLLLGECAVIPVPGEPAQLDGVQDVIFPRRRPA